MTDARPSLFPFVGHEDYRYDADDHEEWTTWIGKPWRRLEYLRQRTFWKGECVDTTRTWSATLGLIRFGWHFHVSVTRSLGSDYSDEERQ